MAKKKAPTKKADGFGIVSVEAKDFHCLKFARVEHVPGKGLVTIVGKNASGKTSLLRVIMACLGGGGAIRKDTIRKGADRASVSIELENGYTIVRKFSEDNPKGTLKVIDKFGGHHGQAKLNEWCGDRSFDPLSFFTLKPAAQRDVLLSIATDPELAANLAELNAERQGAYDRRTPYISRKQVAGRVVRPDGDKPEPIDMSVKIERLRELEALQAKRNLASLDAHDAQRAVELATDQWERQKGQVAHLAEQLEISKTNAEDARVKHSSTTALLEQAIERVEQLPDHTAAMDDVQEEISNASDEAEALRPWTRWEEARVELDEVQCTIDSLTEEIEKNDDTQARLLAKSGIPVDNLTFSEDGEPLLNEHPLAVASGREKIDMAVNVAMAAAPDLKICLLDEANDLDEDALTLLNDRAIAQGFQIWLARIAKEGGGSVIVTDGEAVGVDNDPTDAEIEAEHEADYQETMEHIDD